MVKSPVMIAAIDSMSRSLFGRGRSEAIAENTCVMCGGPAVAFSDEISRKEYGISGMCQPCQNFTFGTDPD